MYEDKIIINLCRYELHRLFDRAQLMSLAYKDDSDVPILLRNFVANMTDDLRRFSRLVDEYCSKEPEE